MKTIKYGRWRVDSAKTLLLAIAMSLFLVGCTSEREDLRKRVGDLELEKQGLVQAVENLNLRLKRKDEFIEALSGMITSIQEHLEAIRQQENILLRRVLAADAEGAIDEAEEQNIRLEIDALADHIQEQKAKVIYLEQELDEERTEHAALRTVVGSLRQDISSGEILIADMRTAIEELRKRVADTQLDLTQTSHERDRAQRQVSELSKVYYLVDSPRGLRDKKITCRGVLDKTDLCDIKRSYLTEATNALSEIYLGQSVHSYKIFTVQENHPALHRLERRENGTYLLILNPREFWSKQRDLIVEIKD